MYLFQICAGYMDLNASQYKQKIHWEYCYDNSEKKITTKGIFFADLYPQKWSECYHFYTCNVWTR